MVKPKRIFSHFSILVFVLTVLTLGIIFPFMPGNFDRLSQPLSAIIQVCGIIGMLLTVYGVLWFSLPNKINFFTNSLFYLLGLLIVIITYLAYLIAGILFGLAFLIVFSLSVLILWQRFTNTVEKEALVITPFYLVGIPLSILTIQLLIAKPVTDWSRDRTITNAYEYIRDIEEFKSKNGYYPKALQAMYKDYDPKTVGVEQFYYLPFGDSYNISFEQPRFILDIIGTK